MGRRLDAHALCRNDGKAFYKNNLPNEVPRISVGLLLDESGSMSCGDLATYARAAAIIMYDFCQALDKEGRAYIHENLSSVNMDIVHYLMRNPVKGESVEYNDNRISLYIAQKGKCAITGELLDIGKMHCHHVNPKKQGGNDRYSNLKYVAEPVHILIHATQGETVERYLEMLKLTEIQLKKLNVLRCKAGNSNWIYSSER